MSNAGKPVFQFSIAPPQKQNRWGVLLRLFIAIPQLVFAAFMIYAAGVLTCFAWFYMIFTGRNPYHDFNSKAVRAYQRVIGYMYLLTSDYPAFSLDEDPDYPIASLLEQGPLVRMKVLFRLILMIPILIVWWLLGFGLFLLGFVSWITVLIRGTLPKSMHESIGAIVRFDGRILAYVMLLQDPYPRGLFGDKVSTADAVAAGDVDQVVTDAVAPSPSTPPETSVGLSSTTEMWSSPNAELPLDTSAAPETAAVVSPQPARSWAMSLSRGAKRVIAVSLVVGTIAAVCYTAFVPSWQYRTTPTGVISASSWNSQYRGDVVSFQKAVVSDESTLTKKHHDWSAILGDCQSLQSQYAVFDSVPYYPQSGPDQNLLSGLTTIYTSLNSCVTVIAPYKVSHAVAYLKKQLETGNTDFENFLRQT